MNIRRGVRGTEECSFKLRRREIDSAVEHAAMELRKRRDVERPKRKRPVGHRHWRPVRRRVPVTAGWVKVPGGAAGEAGAHR